MKNELSPRVYAIIGIVSILLWGIMIADAYAAPSKGPPPERRYWLCWNSEAKPFYCRWIIPGLPPTKPPVY